MTAHALTAPSELRSMSALFSRWIDRSAVAPRPKGARASALVSPDRSAALDAASASAVIRQGLRAGHVSELVELLGLAKKEDLSLALNTNSTSLWRWARDDKPLPSATVEQILRAMQLQLFATEVFGAAAHARQWLFKPHPSLDGMTPSAYADNEFGAQKVRGLLAALRYGGVA